MKNIENCKKGEHKTKLNDSVKPDDLPSPKRGAFPTPKTEIESAKRYIPDSDQTDDHQPTKPDSPAKSDAGG